jgi:GTP-binding protein
MQKALVALVGRPNVGKSTLFNRLVGEPIAVVDNTPGTTRDRIIAEVEWNGTAFDLVDTGGIEIAKPLNANPLAIGSADFVTEIRVQTELAIQNADVVVFVADLSTGVTAADLEAADLLRRQQRYRPNGQAVPILLAVNKGESMARRDDVYDFYQLGLGEPIVIGAMHGIGTGDLLDSIVNALPNVAPESEDESVRIAIVGRPNVGKSSLLNRLLGEERAIVSPIAGTTRDAIDTPMRFDGQDITLIDTAGIRRRGRIEQGIEKYSVMRTLRALQRADVALLLIDATEPFTAQDAHVAGMILEQHVSVVLVVNKWDAIEKDSHTLDQFRAMLLKHLRFVDYAPVLFISAKTGQRTGEVMQMALQVNAQRNLRLSTAAVNKLLRDSLDKHPAPTTNGKRLKIMYGTQVRVAPPVFLFHVNEKDLVHFSYTRFLENQIRAQYGFLGTPLRISYRENNE